MRYIIFITLILFYGCSSNEDKNTTITTIATIKKASGICYVDITKTLFVVSDNGFVYEIDTNGTILNKKEFDIKNRDFEGIAYDSKSDYLYIAVEGVDNLLVITKELEYIKEINVDREDSKNRKILKSGGEGLEAIAILNSEIYLANQSFKTLPKDDPSVVVKIELEQNNKASLAKIINHGYLNISGMDFYDDFLYLLSDSNNLIVKYDLNTYQSIKEWRIKKDLFDKESKDIALEGIAFDNSGYIYFAVDDKNSGEILKASIDILTP